MSSITKGKKIVKKTIKMGKSLPPEQMVEEDTHVQKSTQFGITKHKKDFKKINCVSIINSNEAETIEEDGPVNYDSKFMVVKESNFTNISALNSLKLPNKSSLNIQGSAGDIIFNTADGTFYGFDGVDWIALNGVQTEYIKALEQRIAQLEKLLQQQ